MGHPHIFIQLSDEQNTELLALEKNPLINNKVRLRASIIRLSSTVDWVHFRGHEVRFKIRIGEHHVKTNQNLHTRV